MNRHRELHKSRWNRFRQMNKRRVNQFLLEKRVERLAHNMQNEAEITRLSSEQTEQLLNQLEQKLAKLVEKMQKLSVRITILEATPPAPQKPAQSWWQKLVAVLCSRGEP